MKYTYSISGHKLYIGRAGLTLLENTAYRLVCQLAQIKPVLLFRKTSTVKQFMTNLKAFINLDILLVSKLDN